MMYYCNWVLTNAQLELIAADVSVVDYNYSDKKDKKGKGRFDDTPASEESVQRANESWLAKHSEDGGVMNLKDILGNKLMEGVGIKIK